MQVRNLEATLGGFSLRNINLSIHDKEYFVIVGPTGAGKSVFLKWLAGLYRFPAGTILLNGHNVTSLPPERRRIGYVPQDYALFPFLNVRENILFGTKASTRRHHLHDNHVDQTIELLGIGDLLERDVASLSGGEQQRVALARALAISPKFLLLDEPLSSLDVRTSKYLRLELRRLHRELQITTIHVTHNLIEAEELADRMAIMHEGTIQQVGTPSQVFFYPDTDVVSDFLGTPNILTCDECRPLGHGLVEAVCGGITIVLPHQGDVIRKIALFPRDIYVATTKPPGPDLNRFEATVTDVSFFSSLVRLRVTVGTHSLLTELPRDIFKDLDIVVGDRVFLILKLKRLRTH